MKYKVTNIYGVKGDTNHRTPEAAIKARDKREGIGWVVCDQDGNELGRGPHDKPVIVRYAEGYA
jgi:hypothetical protein